MKPTGETRVSFSLFPEDVSALRKLHLALMDQGEDIKRAHLLRLVLFALSEAELFSHAVLRLQQEERGEIASGATIEERFSAVLPNFLLSKLTRVTADLARKNVDVERTFIVRAALHSSPEQKTLIQALPKLEKEFPDKRALKPKKR